MCDEMIAKLTEKLRQELDGNHPYEAMLYVQTFVARKRRQISHLESCKLIFKGIEILLESHEEKYAGTLYDWMLTQNLIELQNLREIFDLTLGLISTSTSQTNISEFVNCIFNPLFEYLESNKSLTALERTKYLYELNQKCGEIFEKTQRWQEAKNSYLSIGDITGVVRVTHLWAEDGYPSEYPLFFARVYLSLLANKLVPQAAAFFRAATDEYLDSYEFTLQLDSPQLSTSSYSIWQMCILLNDLLGLIDTPSVVTKIDPAKLYGIILSRFEALLKYFDRSLYDLSKVVGFRVFNVREERNDQNAGPMAFMNRLMMGAGR
jgi:hypothetical protein